MAAKGRLFYLGDRQAPHHALEDRLAGMVQPALEAMGFELVCLRLTGGAARPNVQIMAERTDGEAMGVKDCAAISRALDGPLERADLLAGRWQLEVSSPGIDRPLVRLKDWNRALDRLARVELAEPISGRRRYSGVVLGVEEGAVRLRLDDASEVVLPLGLIRRARLVLTPELLAGARLAIGGN